MQKPRILRAVKEVGRRNEDAFAWNQAACRFVLSDGASTSYAGRAWARALCWQFMRDPEFGSEWLGAARSRFWQSVVPAPADDWSAPLAFERGSFATFLGVTILPECIIGHAVGDSVLFVVDGEKTVRQFPLMDSPDFKRDPVLLGSHPGVGLFDESDEGFCTGRIRLDIDVAKRETIRLIAATDAIAEWLVGEGSEQGLLERLVHVSEIKSTSQFHEFVGKARSSGTMRRDDCTVLVVEI
jgi:hypothetical protein